ncbi:MAG: von Willebrand factor type A domain-containing protein, partial [Synergistaceae bacterium]|nr:von Willebrand factor type A domain-containing protein [Synergistaceae bacterium]
MKRHLAILLMLFLLASRALAATNPFMDVPAGHWAYDAMAQLAARGVITGYSDSTSEDQKPITRYEMASIIARSLGHLDLDKASKQDVEMLKRLIAEFSDEMSALGVSVDNFESRLGKLEADTGGWQLYGNNLSFPTSAPSFGAQGLASDSTQAFSMASAMPPMPRQARDTARYADYDDNPVKIVARDPLSTFSLDVNTTSYANVRRFLNEGRLPNPDAVRVEELINYFPAADGDMKQSPLSSSPFSVACELAPCPWNENNTLMWISLTASDIDYEEAPPANLVFLVDVSGSMSPSERLPLVKSALKMLAGQLRPSDAISLVTYAGATRVVLEATKGNEKNAISSAIDRLRAGGSTAGAAGLALAYEQAEKYFIKGGVNRILLCTDGDFNVGVSSPRELEAMVKKRRESGITLSVLGFGTDNYNDEMMTRISNVGNGNYSYIDSMSEARKVLDEEMSATLVTVAKDTKAQIEFNPANVIEYRQLGYEKRQLENEDFNNDLVDAG